MRIAALAIEAAGPVPADARPDSDTGGGIQADEVSFTGQAMPPEQPLALWYQRPAGEWLEALPLGNGRLGAMVYGGVPTERIAAQRRHALVGRAEGLRQPRGPQGPARDPPADLRGQVRRGPRARQEDDGTLHPDRTYPWVSSCWTFDDPGNGGPAPGPGLSPRARPRPRRRDHAVQGRRRGLHARGLRLASRSGDGRPPHGEPAAGPRLHGQAGQPAAVPHQGTRRGARPPGQGPGPRRSELLQPAEPGDRLGRRAWRGDALRVPPAGHRRRRDRHRQRRGLAGRSGHRP